MGRPKKLNKTIETLHSVAASGNQIIWEEDPEDGNLAAFVVDPITGHKQRCAWAPQPGSQEALLSAVPIFEVLYEGNRGGGKTDGMLMNFGQFVGAGYGADWTGILFRQTYPELEDVKRKCASWFPKIWPQAVFNMQTNTWTWPSGEQLLFRHAKKEDDYQHYHGHNYPCVMFEELTTWADPGIYLMLMSVCRSARKGIPMMYRATTNPYGPGHNWVKQRFRLPIESGEVIGRIITDSINRNGDLEPPRVAIHGHFDENLVLKHADPNYFAKLNPRNPAQLAAWKHGSWHVVAGGMIDDVWEPAVHVVPDFAVPPSWRIDRAFDWGSSKPFSVGWWAESDGTPVALPNGKTMRTVRGDVFLVKEWYGTNGQPNEGLRWTAKQIAEGIIKRECGWGWREPGLKKRNCRVRMGPADSSIFDIENGVCIADDMGTRYTDKKSGFVYRGVEWTAADKRSGSRKQGWEALRQALSNSMPTEDGTPREFPGVFIMASNHHWIENVPNLPRDKKDPDDVDTDAEDHDGDMTRYRVRQMNQGVRSGVVTGTW